MNTKANIRSFLVLLACGAIALSGACGQAYASGSGTTETSGTTNWVAGTDSEYHTIIDFTQGSSDNVVVSNTQSTNKQRAYPYIASDTDPWAAINPANYPPGYTAGAPDLYVNVKFDNTDISSGSLSAATTNTCDQGDPTKCPSGTLPNTFVHRVGTYNSSSGTVTALSNSKLVGGYETLNNMFTKNGQAFDMDRLRYAANRLWAEWRKEVLAKSGPWYDKFYNVASPYQPTGTMSFENFVNNIVNHHPMYGLVRVVIPVETQGGSGKRVGDMYLDPSYPVAGAEFTNPPGWVGTGTKSSQPVMVDYEAMWPGTSVPSSATSSSKREPYSGTVTVYGMLLIDYVDSRTYTPDNFFDSAQDYVDNYSSQAVHDSTSIAGRENVILPRSSGRNVVLMDWDTLDINPIDDLVSQVQYTDTATAGGDGRMDTLDIIRRKYMMAGSTNYQASEISDDYVWEYWMRQAVLLQPGDSTRNQIITDLTGNPPGNSGTGTAQFDYATQKFTTGASELTNFDNGYKNMGWPYMTEPDQFHAYFPSGYEMGWMRAFYNLDMAYFDQNDTTEQTPGSWWMHLPDAATTTDNQPIDKGYAEFAVPGTPDGWMTVSLDGNPADAQAMPNFFTTDWEDFPAFAFAGGLLDVHGFMNCSGMLYTPDSLEIEAHSGSELPGGSSSAGPFQYENGALLVGNGFFLQDQNTGDHSMIAISYNYNSFDRLRSGAASLTVKTATNIAELQGQ